MKKVTIQDVADASEVSKATISRYLNGQWNRMNQQTRQKIANKIEELGYIPNQQARSLKAKHNKIIGLIVADIANLYTSRLIKGIQTTLRKEGYRLLIYDSSNNLKDEAESIKYILAQNVDGIILQPLSSDSTQYKMLNNLDCSVILVDRQTYPLSWESVTSNDFVAAQQLMSLVFRRGYKEVSVITGEIDLISTRSLRYNGVLEAAKQFNAKVELDELNDEYSVQLEKIVKSSIGKHKVLFATNGQLLIDIIKICKEFDIKVPEDVAVVGYDDMSVGDLTTPGISAINQKPVQIGKEVARKLIEYIGDEDKAEPSINMIDSKIVERQSF